jgi:hypothetical protein
MGGLHLPWAIKKVLPERLFGRVTGQQVFAKQLRSFW